MRLGGSGGGTGCGECDGGRPVETETFSYDSPLLITSKPRAQYTDAARLEHLEGTVALRVTFLANGSIGGIYLIKGLGLGLNNEAIHAARQITFHPKIINGRPISVTRTVQYNFNIY